MKRIISIFLIISMIVLCTSCGTKQAKKEPYSTSFECFDTVCKLTIYDKKPKKELDKIATKLTDICIECDGLFNMSDNSHYYDQSEGKTFGFGEDYCDIAYWGIKYGKLTDGALDITIDPIVKLWNINGVNFKVPSDSDIKDKLKLVDYKKIEDGGNLYTIDKNQTIDLGAIAKGYVTDRLIEELDRYKVKSALIDLGGNIYAYGSKEGKPFKVGIKKPFSKDELSATVNAKDKAVITAGIYQRYKKYKGKIYSHIMDPKTGRPVDNDLNSVTIISNNPAKATADDYSIACVAADAYSTACMVMGLDKGMKFVNNTKDIEAVFIDKDNKLHLSKGLEMKGDEINIK